MAGGHFVLGFQSTLCASAGSILIGLLGRKDFIYVDWTLLLSDRRKSPTILFYCILNDTVESSFSTTYTYIWLCFLFWISQCLSNLLFLSDHNNTQ